MAIINGTFLPDILVGTNGDDVINGFGGLDILSGLNGADVIDGGAGDDILNGDDGNDTLYGGTGAASILSFYNGGQGNDRIVAAPDGVAENFNGGDGVDTASFELRNRAVDARLSLQSVPVLLDSIVAIENLVGTRFNDTLIGDDQNNVLSGGAGEDVLDGLTGNDTLQGGLGNDTFTVDSASDLVQEAAGEGFDRVTSSVTYALAAGSEVELLRTADAAATVSINFYGNEFGNALYGNAGSNVLTGAGGSDYLVGLGGVDVLYGGDGDDALDGGAGQDSLFGGAGTDTLVGGADNDSLDGQAGDDSASGGTGNDVYHVDSAGDRVTELAGEGFDRVIASVSYALAADSEVELLQASDMASTAAIDLVGNGFANSIYGNAGGNVLAGGGGSDYLVGLEGADILYGDDGEDALDGGAGQDALVGGAGNDTLVGGADNDSLYGLAGDDNASGGTGDDVYYIDSTGDRVNELAGEGFDRVISSVSVTLLAGSEVELLQTADTAGTASINFFGNEFANSIYGNSGSNVIGGAGGSDYIVGLDGDDVLHGEDGDDAIDGGEGGDLLYGGAGSDYLVGGGGLDYFVFTSAPGAGNVDRIVDFVAGTDRISLDDAVFTTLTPIDLPAGAFHIGSAAADADDRIVYDAGSGALYYDADGSGAGAAVQFATLSANLALTNADFLVI